MAKPDKRVRKYLGIDVGGTKLLAAVVEESGGVIGRERAATPRDVEPEEVVVGIENLMDMALARARVRPKDLAGIGVAIPGVVDVAAGRIVVTPNMNLGGMELGARLEDRFHVPVALANDCDLGTLGEAWLGSARRAGSAVGIFVGTGIGAGIVRKGKLWRGARDSAGEIGHMVMQIGGPKCGCNNRGCLEALASRTAIERDLSQAVAAGRKTLLTESLGGDLSLIRSSELRRALEAGDELVSEVMRKASEVLGHACLSVRHLIDPEVIVLGGGVVNACSSFMLPIIEAIVAADCLPGSRTVGGVRLSALGDDAVVLGAVALARRRAGRSPFKSRYNLHPDYPRLTAQEDGRVKVGRVTYQRDFLILADGRIKDRKLREKQGGDPHQLSIRELERLSEGGPERLFFAAGPCGEFELGEDVRQWLRQRSIEWTLAPTPEAAAAYSKSSERRAALFHITCPPSGVSYCGLG